MTPPAARTAVVAIGDQPQIAGFALVGVRLSPAATPAEVQDAWRAAFPTAAVVILTDGAASSLGDERHVPDAPLTVVMPA
jgi:vacuolar-type H+-ATPase subunit F/Vma7